MTGYFWAVLGTLAALVMTTLGAMVSQEIRDRLDHLPHAVLRIAAYRLSPTQRITVYQAEWLPELTYILEEAEARPITRLVTGTRYALGILASTSRIARHLNRQDEEAATADQNLLAPERNAALHANQNLFEAERNAALREAVAALPPRGQQLIAMLSSEPPESYAEISTKLGIPIGSIGPTRARCLDKIRRHQAAAALDWLDQLRD